MAREKGKGARWTAAVAAVRDAFELLEQRIEEVREIQEEYQEWQDNLPENLQTSATAEKLDTVVELDLDMAGDLESMIEEIENVDLPQGFGRD